MQKLFLIAIISLLLAFNSKAQSLSKPETASLKRLQDHINYLASDRLEGRGTGSAGEKLSAQYIANVFKSNKLKPLGNQGTYLQEFNFVTLRMAKDSTGLFINGLPIRLFQDFYPLSFTANHKIVDGKALEVGYGIDAPELKHNDYKGKDIAGKIAIIDISAPDSQQAHSKFINYLSLETRVKKAESMGAVGVIFINSGFANDPSGELSKNISPSGIPVFFVVDRHLLFNPPGGLPVTMKSILFNVSATGHNVIAYKNNKAKYTIIIGAHHDHLGRGEIKGSREPESSEVHNGADDNASGTSALMELSKKLTKRKYRKFNYVFIAFSGEEMGLLGSKYFVENPTIHLNQVSYMLNMDMIGRLKETLIIYGTGTSPYWPGAITSLKKDSTNIHKIKTIESGIGASDHTSFYLDSIPVLHFFTGQHDQYHKPSDDIALLNLPGEVKIIGKMIQLISESPSNAALEFTKSKDEGSRGDFKVTLGIMPDYAYDAEGIRVDGVKDGKPGANAGLKKGDIIISLANEKIVNMETYVKVLKKLEMGQVVQLIFLRDGKANTVEVKF